MAEPIDLRDAAARDIDMLLRCDAYAQTNPSRRVALDRWIARGECLVAESEGRIVGFVVLEHGFFGHAFVPLVCVAPGHRRLGFATAMLAAVQSRCRTDKLFTSTNASNARAKQMLEKTGFVPSGTIENLDAGDPELVYFKRLR